MAKIAGKTGWVEAPSVVVGINEWTLDYVQDELETTDFSASGDYTCIVGKKKGSGSFTGFRDGIPLTLSANSISVWLAAGSASTTAYHGQAFITGLHAGANVDGVATVGYDYVLTASLTVPTA